MRQQPPVEHPVRGQSTVGHDRLHQVHEQRRDMGRGNRIEQYAGRLHREHASKTDVRIIDLIDTGYVLRRSKIAH